MPKQWIPAQEQLDMLFAWLGSTREEAGATYEHVRQNLINLFVRNNCLDAEDLADQTIDRVIKKLPGLTESYTGDPALYFYGVAKNMLLEWRRQNSAHSEASMDELGSSPGAEPDSTESDLRFKCLEKCLQKLPRKNRNLILQYYSEEKRAKIDFRREMARNMGIDVINLRVRMHRIRGILHKCIKKCLAESDSVQ